MIPENFDEAASSGLLQPRLVRRCGVWNETQGTCHTPDTYDEERTRYPAMVMWDLGWEQCEREGWRNPLTDPPTQTGKILVWMDGIGPTIVNVEERWMCFWDGYDETEPTSPDEWTAWREILPPNAAGHPTATINPDETNQ